MGDRNTAETEATDLDEAGEREAAAGGTGPVASDPVSDVRDPSIIPSQKGVDAAGISRTQPRRGRNRTRRVFLGALALLAVGLLMVGGSAWWAVDHYTGKVDRISGVFPTKVPAAAQPAPSEGGQTFLLVGVDSRSALPTTGRDAKAPEWKYGAQRSDTMMLVHLPADHSGAYVVSLPRDAWVDIPGHGKAKLNAAFSWGGPPLLIDTVQRLTKVRVDHLAVIDWDGFKKLTDSVGGVDLVVDGADRHMNGTQALVYVRERYHLARGDFDRTHRQQYFLRTLLAKVMRPSTFSNPVKATEVLDDLTAAVSVDDRLGDGDLRDLLWDNKEVRPGDIVFMNAPAKGTGMISGQSVVLLDSVAGPQLWRAMREDALDDYLQSHDADRLGATTP
ncbi:cell envelope-related function transcriptional attenuator common domain-containing protein [Streptomyces sp. 136MFCol5.1]|nr:cell envelope-related function transcriptional attenuator common domain-containing protein [Streptomyces sp. 136MFCol5.1]SFT24852.1 transcriptional attenuator, LytR family [Streptomyces sp. ok210]